MNYIDVLLHFITNTIESEADELPIIDINKSLYHNISILYYEELNYKEFNDFFLGEYKLVRVSHWTGVLQMYSDKISYFSYDITKV